MGNGKANRTFYFNLLLSSKLIDKYMKIRLKKRLNLTDNKLSLIAYLINQGISIPHYCYHNNLSIAGNCRICLVELENSPKPVVSCGINAKSCLINNEIYYDSVFLRKA